MKHTLSIFKCYAILALLLIPGISYADLPPQIIARLCVGDTLDNFGHIIESAGDINNDGYNDVWIYQNYWSSYPSSKSPDSMHGLYLYYGGNPMDTIPDLILRDSIMTIKNIGDVNGDTFDDFISVYYNHELEHRIFKIFFGGEIFDTIPEKIFIINEDSLISALLGYIKSILIIDYNGDSSLDMVLGSAYADHNIGRVIVYNDILNSDTTIDIVFSGYSYPAHMSFGERLCFIEDLNGTDYIAISQAGNTDSNTTGIVFFYEAGAGFDTIPDLVINSPPGTIYHYWGGLIENLGDVNADGAGDFAVGLFMASNGYIYFGGDIFDTLPDVTIVPSFEKLESIGDVNNDTYPDFIVGEQPFNGRAWIYYGGPDVDGIVDMKVSVPNDLNNFGKTVKGLGDVNGDGVDDFAVAGMVDVYDWWPGAVYIYSGYDSIPTDVIEEGEPELPEKYELRQNFPNPFNLSTTIAFEIPTRQTVTLCIYDILGREIRRLLDKSLTAGKYKINWDGLDNSGNPVSSGIYLYRLETESAELSKKMILLK